MAKETPSLSLLGMAGQGFHQEGQGFAELGSALLRLSRPVSRSLEVAVELYPFFLVRQPLRPPYGARETVEALAADLGLRWFPAPSGWKVAPYVEVLEGPFYGLRRIPASGSAFNFLTQMGAGVVLKGAGPLRPVLGCRWVHISNAGLGSHNPDWDFWTLLLGGTISASR